MGRVAFILLLLAASVALPARAQNVVQEFSGSGPTTTGFFTVGDRWEVRWNAKQAISVAALSSNGTIVAGASGVLRGSLFVPSGGQYYLKISDGTEPPPAPVAGTNAAPAAAGTNAAPANAPANTNAAPVAATNAAPVASTNAPPMVVDTPSPIVVVPGLDAPIVPAPSWHLQVVQIAQTVASTDSLTVYAPYFTMPDAAIVQATPPPAPPPPTLTPEQVRALVTIKGDNAQGNGFLLRMPDGVFAACQVHLLAANPNLQVISSSGAMIKVLSVKSATDRDLALIAVQDDHLDCLTLPDKGDPPAAPGDAVLIPAVGESDALGGKAGKIVDFGPGRVDFDDPLNGDSLGTPVIHVASGKALAIVAAERRNDLSDAISNAWAGNSVPGSAAIIPFYGTLLSDVAGWEPLDLDRFTNESSFVQNFHETTRCLDSYLNGRRRRAFNPRNTNGPPDSQYFSKNAQISTANDTYHKYASGSDRNQGLDAARELLYDLQAVADSDLDRLQSASMTYSFNRQRVQEELAYRKAIKAQLDGYSDNINRLDNIARNR